MNSSFLRRNLLTLQWIVIGVLILGGTTAVFLAMHKADSYKAQIQNEAGVMASLHEQIIQARHPNTIVNAQLPEATANGPATPTPTPVITAKPVTAKR